MKVPFFDLRVVDPNLKDELTSAFHKVISKGRLFINDDVEELEKKVANYLGVKYALGVSSGSSAIYLALKSSGISNEDEIITTPLTWIIPANAIVANGAKPVFSDVKNDFNLDPDLIIDKISSKTKGILLMHYAGHMCKMDKFIEIAAKHNLDLFEDAAQAFGASLNKKKAGSFSKAAGFSMNPMKFFGGYGEAGMLVTNNKEIYDRAKRLRHAGTTSDYKQGSISNNCIEVSLNHKMDAINASLLLVSFKHLEAKRARVEKIAKYYKDNLHQSIHHQKIFDNEIHGRYMYPIYLDQHRDEIKNHLSSLEIETKTSNAPLVYDAPDFLKYKNENLIIAEKMLANSLMIPCNDKLSDDQVYFVVKSINTYFN